MSIFNQILAKTPKFDQPFAKIFSISKKTAEAKITFFMCTYHTHTVIHTYLYNSTTQHHSNSDAEKYFHTNCFPIKRNSTPHERANKKKEEKQQPTPEKKKTKSINSFNTFLY